MVAESVSDMISGRLPFTIISASFVLPSPAGIFISNSRPVASVISPITVPSSAFHLIGGLQKSTSENHTTLSTVPSDCAETLSSDAPAVVPVLSVLTELFPHPALHTAASINANPIAAAFFHLFISSFLSLPLFYKIVYFNVLIIYDYFYWFLCAFLSKRFNYEFIINTLSNSVNLHFNIMSFLLNYHKIIFHFYTFCYIRL